MLTHVEMMIAVLLSLFIWSGIIPNESLIAAPTGALHANRHRIEQQQPTTASATSQFAFPVAHGATGQDTPLDLFDDDDFSNFAMVSPTPYMPMRTLAPIKLALANVITKSTFLLLDPPPPKQSALSHS